MNKIKKNVLKCFFVHSVCNSIYHNYRNRIVILRICFISVSGILSDHIVMQNDFKTLVDYNLYNTKCRSRLSTLS